MTENDQSKEFKGSYRIRKTILFPLLSVVAWTILIAAFYFYLDSSNQDFAYKHALSEARTHFNKDVALRRWATSHGGVYVPISITTYPNPYLAHLPERDIETPSGKALTLMNPAYFLRQLQENYSELFGVKGHITSLKPLRPENHPDEWQKKALGKFEHGVQEYYEFIDYDGEPYLRLMQPVFAEEGCLKCHAYQGYSKGDVKGGVGVSVPMRSFLKQASDSSNKALITLSITWLLGCFGILTSGRIVAKYLSEKENAFKELVVNNKILDDKIRTIEELNKDLEAFDYTLSNALKVPIRHIRGFSQIIGDSVETGNTEELKSSAEVIHASGEQLSDLVDSILILSRANRQDVVREETDLVLLASHLIDRIKSERELPKLKWIAPDKLDCRCDSSLIKIFLYNLLDNAAKYSAARGENQLVELGEITKGDSRVLYIRDNGIGFEMERVERLFVPFHSYHEDNDFEGLGLGLATAKRIIERHGGSLWAESEPEQGATFYFTVPI